VLASVLALLSLGLSAVTGLWFGAAITLILVVSAWGYRTLISQPTLIWQVLGSECFRWNNSDSSITADPKASAVPADSPRSPQPARQPMQIRRSWHLSTWLLQLHYRDSGQRRWRSVLVWPDSACPETRRILRSHEAFKAL
jgi:hypothetical protein